MCVWKPWINPSSPSVENKDWAGKHRRLPRPRRSGGAVEGGFCLLPTWVLAPPGTQPLPGRFEGGQTQVWTNYRSLRVGCCRAGPGPVPGHARFPTSAHPHPLQRSGFLGKPGQHPHAGLALAAVSAFAEKLREAKSFSFHLVRPARLPWHSGTRKRRRAFAIWGGGKRSSAGKGQGL